MKLIPFTILLMLMLPNGHASQEKLIIGELDWQEINEFAPDDLVVQAASPVALLDFKKLILSSRCTGVLLSESILMTNHHCISGRFRARKLKAAFRFQYGAGQNTEVYSCERFLGGNRALDYSLVRCDGRPGRRLGYHRLSAVNELRERPAFVVQQNCQYYIERDCLPTKKVAFGEILGARTDGYLVHNMDTLGGSSGSPIFDAQTGQLIALHRAGIGIEGGDQGEGSANLAVSIDLIRNDILRRFPELRGELGQ